jgi:hypothetical protein
VKIRFGFLAGHTGHDTLHRDLPLHRQPGEEQCRAGVGVEFAALAALVIRIKHEPAPVAGLEQHRAGRGPAIARRGRERHRVRLRDLRGFGFLKPLLELSPAIL